MPGEPVPAAPAPTRPAPACAARGWRLEQRQRIALARHRRQGVGQVGAIQRLRDGAAQRQLRQAFGAGIDGRERGGQRRIGVDHARVHHLAAEQAAADLAARAQTLAHGHLLLLAGVEIQPAQLQLTAVVGQRGRQLAPGPVQHLGLGDLAFDLCGKARPQRGDRDYAGFILVAQRQVQHEVFGRHQSQIAELALRIRQRFAGAALGCARALGAAAAAGMEERASVMKCPGGAYRTRMASTSNCAPLGRLATPMVERAGKG